MQSLLEFHEIFKSSNSFCCLLEVLSKEKLQKKIQHYKYEKTRLIFAEKEEGMMFILKYHKF